MKVRSMNADTITNTWADLAGEDFDCPGHDGTFCESALECPAYEYKPF